MLGAGGAAVIGVDQGWFTPDTKPEVYLAPVRTLARTLSTWDPDPHLGQPNSRPACSR